MDKPKWAGWTDQNMSRLKELVALGLSSTQIAKEMHATSRNVIIGKCSRMGLQLKSMNSNPALKLASAMRKAEAEKARKAREEARSELARQERARIAALAARKAVETIKPVIMPDHDNARPWTSRRFGECAFPVDGDGADTRSCCHRTEPGKVYCEDHRLVMYQQRMTITASDMRHFTFVANRSRLVA